jgi:hypothetical protein
VKCAGLEKRVRELEAERDAIEAATSERCAQIADDSPGGELAAKYIRELAKND